MTVTTPRGFRAAGISVGLKTSGAPDLALVVNDGPERVSASVYTANRAQANSILWSKAAKVSAARAIILNSGGANCFTGEFGYDTARLTAEAVAHELRCDRLEVQVASTGLIGYGGQEFRDRIVGNVPALVTALSADDTSAPKAILTTDTVEKTAQYVHPAGWSIGGMAKGAGMLAPGLATMLVVLTTDASLSAADLDAALRESTRVSFDRLDSDGCMSTNDHVALFACLLYTSPSPRDRG